MCPCGKAKESRTHSVGECEMYTEERDVLEDEMRKIDDCDVDNFWYTQDDSEEMIAIVGDKRWQQKSKQEGNKVGKNFVQCMEKTS